MAQEAAGEEHTGKTLGGYTPALPGLGKLSLCDLHAPGPWVSHLGHLVTTILHPAGKRKKKKDSSSFLSSLSNKEHLLCAWNNAGGLQEV